jgi:colicin import membrane protein
MEMTIMPNELIVASEINAVEVFTGKDGIAKIVSDIEKQIASFIPDTSTVKGRKDIASLAYKVSQSKVILDDLGKALVADWKSKSALVDASRKIARQGLMQTGLTTEQSKSVITAIAGGMVKHVIIQY